MDEVTRVEMDRRGEECPAPTIKTVDAIKGLRRPDAAICAADIPYQAGTLGYSSETKKTGDAEWEIVLAPPASKRRSRQTTN